MGRDVNMPAMQLHWDIFCRVVDNYGDIGVCWRLARQLAAEHGKAVRLWVDDPASLAPLCPEADPALALQQLRGVEIRRWDGSFAVDRVAEVIIEAFACELPPAYIDAMAATLPSPCWINLEYLTAEPWAESCHGMASPHPRLPLVKYFFFPGFSSSTGGLLRESGLPVDSSSMHPECLEISLFCYDTAPVGSLLDALATTPQPVRCHVPPGKPLAAVASYLGGNGPWQLGQAVIEATPFLPMDEYDALLRRCDINFVRGEDSFVRAQWAGKPFVWQIYRQEDDAHRVKLAAFVERYCQAMDSHAAQAVRRLFLAWNDGDDCREPWQAFLAQRGEIARHTLDWRDFLTRDADLATKLVKFCAGEV